MEEDFYATIKFKSGEEVFARVAASEEEDRTMLVIHNPVMIVELKSRSGMTAYKIEPWLKTTKDDMFIINLDDVITLSESFDVEMMVMHQQYVHDNNLGTNNSNKINRRMGYISSVTDAKEILEKIFKNSPKKT